MVPQFFTNDQTLTQLVIHTREISFLTLMLSFKLEALPLTLELTTLGGNLWQRTLSGGRAERIEYLLLHAFHNNGYLLPDKYIPYANNRNNKNNNNDNDNKSNNKRKRQKASYSGGLVLDPEPGLYDSLILLLDFNSLYPSIIREYNICYTTIKRPSGFGEGNRRNEFHKIAISNNYINDNENSLITSNNDIEDEAEILASIEPPSDDIRRSKPAILPSVIGK